MPKVKLQLQRIVDWKGWRWVYYCVISLVTALTISDVTYMCEILTKTIGKGGMRIPAECCWEYKSRTNFIIYS